MTRMRTKRSSRYLTISNATAQDHSLSFEALGLLTYCLSMPEDWEFHPKSIWKLRSCGRDACYSMFNELIMSYRCIRIRKPNPKSPNLAGEIEYEIFDEVDDCKERIAQLEKTEKFIEHGGNLKKCFRHPAFPDPEARDPENQYTTKTDPDKDSYISSKEDKDRNKDDWEDGPPDGGQEGESLSFSAKNREDFVWLAKKYKLSETQMQTLHYLIRVEGLDTHPQQLTFWAKKHSLDRVRACIIYAKSKKPSNLGAYVNKLLRNNCQVVDGDVMENKKFLVELSEAFNIHSFEVFQRYIKLVHPSGYKEEIPLNMNPIDFAETIIRKFEAIQAQRKEYVL